MAKTKTWKQHREDRGISVSFVAKRLGCTPQTIRNKESKRSTSEFTWLEAVKLCALYNIDISQVKA